MFPSYACVCYNGVCPMFVSYAFPHMRCHMRVPTFFYDFSYVCFLCFLFSYVCFLWFFVLWYFPMLFHMLFSYDLFPMCFLMCFSCVFPNALSYVIFLCGFLCAFPCLFHMPPPPRYDFHVGVAYVCVMCMFPMCVPMLYSCAFFLCVFPMCFPYVCSCVCS